MGGAKNQQIEEWERGYSSPPDRAVCAGHFDDAWLASWITQHADSDWCDYCDAERPGGTCHLDQVLELVAEVLWHGWTRAIEELYYDKEDGYFGPHDYVEEVLHHEIGLGYLVEPDRLREDIVSCFDSEVVCPRDPYGFSLDDSLRFGWRDFAETIKHRSRYVFLAQVSEDRRGDEIEPSQMLGKLGSIVSREGLLREIPAGSAWVRARAHEPVERVETASDLATAPIESAVFANRMSPAGIPMFYAAADEMTAIHETSDGQGVVTTGAFRALRDLLILDLTDLPDVPSVFDVRKAVRRSNLSFLRSLAEEIAKPIERDRREHIDYVPTQVITEYFRRVFRSDDGRRVDGIQYASSRRCGGTCIVLFVEHEECLPSSGGILGRTQVLELDPDTVVRHDCLVSTGRSFLQRHPSLRSAKRYVIERMIRACHRGGA